MNKTVKSYVKVMIAMVFALAIMMMGTQDVKAYGDYADVTGLVQTGATANSITMSWAGENVVSYTIYIQNKTTYDYEAIANTPGTTYTIPNLASCTKYDIKLVGTTAEGDTDYAYLDAVTLPDTMRNVVQTKWWHIIESVDIDWNRLDAAEGYEYNHNP